MKIKPKPKPKPKTRAGRKSIRRVVNDESALASSTVAAQKEEQDRLTRLAARKANKAGAGRAAAPPVEPPAEAPVAPPTLHTLNSSDDGDASNRSLIAPPRARNASARQRAVATSDKETGRSARPKPKTRARAMTPVDHSDSEEQASDFVKTASKTKPRTVLDISDSDEFDASVNNDSAEDPSEESEYSGSGDPTSSGSGDPTSSSDYDDEEEGCSAWDDAEWAWECALCNEQFFDEGTAFTSSDDDDGEVAAPPPPPDSRRRRAPPPPVPTIKKKPAGQVYRQTINIDRTDDEVEIKVPVCLATKLRPHQLDGIRFLWENTVEAIDQYESSQDGGFGCILGHAMGLGKTIQVITFLYAFLRHTSATRALIVVPVNVVENWNREFVKWLPQKHRPRVTAVSDRGKRTDAVEMWYVRGGVLLIGYETFRSTVLSKSTAAATKVMIGRLLDPHICVCDEGHRIKNSKSGISHALSQLKTKRRICLTGSPLQNNLLEYWCMVDFIRPDLLGTKAEFSNRFANPIKNGACINSTAADNKLTRFRSHVLHKIIKNFVHRRTHSIFLKALPKKREYVIQCTLSPVQASVYTHYVEASRGKTASGLTGHGVIGSYAFLAKIWNHPDVLRKTVLNALQNFISDPARGQTDPAIKVKLGQLAALLESVFDPDTGVFKSAEDALKFSQICEAQGVTQLPPKANMVLSGESKTEDEETKIKPVHLAAARHLLVASYEPCDVNHSSKFKVLFSILESAFEQKDKVVVFSQSIATLDSLEEFLNNGFFRKSKWRRDRQYFRLDGQTPVKSRQNMIAQFNRSGSSMRLFLVSTRAGGIGINLIGANRVVVLDSSWNPSHDLQAVCRVFRYGQKKETFMYRLVASGTMEAKIYDRQILKTSLANRVVDEMQQKRVLDLEELAKLMCYQPAKTKPNQGELLGCAAAAEDKVVTALIMKCHAMIDAVPMPHDCFLEDDATANMTESEMAEAQKDYAGFLKAEKGMLETTKSKAPVATVIYSTSQLPKDWFEAVDNKTGKHYYFNSITKQSSWTKPAVPAVADDPARAMERQARLEFQRQAKELHAQANANLDSGPVDYAKQRAELLAHQRNMVNTEAANSFKGKVKKGGSSQQTAEESSQQASQQQELLARAQQQVAQQAQHQQQYMTQNGDGSTGYQSQQSQQQQYMQQQYQYQYQYMQQMAAMSSSNADGHPSMGAAGVDMHKQDTANDTTQSSGEAKGASSNADGATTLFESK